MRSTAGKKTRKIDITLSAFCQQSNLDLQAMIWSLHLRFITLTVLFTLYFMTSLDCVDVTPQKENYMPDYKIYHNVSSLKFHLKRLETQFPNYMKLFDEYVSRNGESQLFIKVFNFSMDSSKEIKRTKILLAYGEHAREFFPVESLLYFIKNITSGINCIKNMSCHKSNYAYTFSSWILSNFEIYIVAMTNPDGRKLIEKNKNYCWRGTANGVDLNRNYDWNFGQKGSSSNPKDDEYRGLYAFSEPETKIFQKITGDISMDAFVSFHSGIRHIYIPFADSLSRKTHRVPNNKDHMKYLAELMSKASSFRPFKYGVASELTGYFADGTSFDFMAGVRKIPFSFAIELWQHRRHQGRSCFDEFNPHSNNLEKELAMVHPLYVELLSYLYKWKTAGSNHDGKVENWQKPLSRFKKDGDHQRFPKRNDVLFPTETLKKDEDVSFLAQLKLVMAFTLALVVVYLVSRQVLNMIRKKRVVSLKSLSSTFSMLKHL